MESVSKEYLLRKPIGRFGWLAASEKIRALSDVSMSIGLGESVAILGSNGAGKTTTIKVLTGIIAPSLGSVRCLGFDPLRDRRSYTGKIGVVMGQKSGLIFDLPLHESFELLRVIFRIEKSEFRSRVAQLSAALEISDLLTVPVRKLSLGQRMRAEILSSLLHRPDIVFLDEPTIGLDLLIRDRIHSILREMNREHGTTIILTSHNPRDIEEITDRVIVLRKGKVAFDGTVQSLKERSVPMRTISFQVNGSLSTLQSELGLGLLVEQSSGRVVASFNVSLGSVNMWVSRILQFGNAIGDVTITEPSLEEAIKRILSESTEVEHA